MFYPSLSHEIAIVLLTVQMGNIIDFLFY